MANPDASEQHYYSNTHRAFIQAFMSRGSMTFSTARPILAKLLSLRDGRQTLPNDVQPADFNDMINAVNPYIHPFDMEIRFTWPQTATSRVPEDAIYALVNLTSDPQTQLATTHSPDEIAYVKRVIDGMFEGTNNSRTREIMAIKGMDAINLAKASRARDSAVGVNGAANGETQGSAGTALTKTDAEKMLGRMVEEGWFEKSGAGYLTLSPRSLLELKDWLIETYNDEVDDEDDELQWQPIKHCDGCRDIVTIGYRCANRDCLCRFHEYCARSYFSNLRDKRCPKCKTEWTGNNYIGEKAASVSRTIPVPNRTSTTSRRESTQSVAEDSD